MCLVGIFLWVELSLLKFELGCLVLAQWSAGCMYFAVECFGNNMRV